MIKDISHLTEKSLSYQKKFLQECTVYEKISAFYFRIHIVSRNYIKFYKANNKEIDVIDLLLNKMWKTPIDDFTTMFLSYPELMDACTGWTFSFFYFPVAKPLSINYGDQDGNLEYRYILDNIRTDEELITIGYLKDFENIDPKGLIRKKGICLDNLEIENIKELKEIIKKRDVNILQDYILSNISTQNLCTNHKSQSEGFILKYKNDVYQINQLGNNKPNCENRIALEYFTHNFAQFISSINFTDCLTSNNYIFNVSSLFLKYYKWVNETDSLKTFNYYHITADDLSGPTFGYYGGTYYDLIPNKTVKTICMENKFFDNIFKILVNGLRKEKKKSKTPYNLIMTDDDIEIWNNVVKIFSVYNKIYKKVDLKNK